MYNRGLVMLSGGQDSATVLAKAMDECKHLHTVTFNYGQRHQIEVRMAAKLSDLAGVTSHWLIPINSFQYIGDSALIDPQGDLMAKHRGDDKLPASFVPGRNLVFLALAGALLYRIEGEVIYCGVSQEDYSGYPDCRDSFINAMQTALYYALDYKVTLETPLLYLGKSGIVKLMVYLGKLPWLRYTHTCYEGQRPPCMECPACVLRQKGFDEAGVKDPLLEE